MQKKMKRVTSLNWLILTNGQRGGPTASRGGAAARSCLWSKWGRDRRSSGRFSSPHMCGDGPANFDPESKKTRLLELCGCCRLLAGNIFPHDRQTNRSRVTIMANVVRGMFRNDWHASKGIKIRKEYERKYERQSSSSGQYEKTTLQEKYAKKTQEKYKTGGAGRGGAGRGGGRVGGRKAGPAGCGPWPPLSSSRIFLVFFLVCFSYFPVFVSYFSRIFLVFLPGQARSKNTRKNTSALRKTRG